MTVLVQTPSRTTQSELQHIVLHGVSWKSYERLLSELDASHLRITFDEGSMELMSPSWEHERHKRLIGRLIETIGLIGNLPITSGGSTTLRRKDLLKGLEPDECFYIENEPRIRRIKQLNLAKVPPPDLVVEIDITHQAIDREEIYAALGVPEIWKFDGRSLVALHLQADRSYQIQSRSRAFPWLQVSDLQKFIHMRTDPSTIARRFVQWLEKNMPADQR